MTRVETLREQASILRALAATFDDQVIRGDLLRLAERCEELATRMAAAIQQAASGSIEALGQPRSEPGTKRTPDTSTK